VCKKEQEEQLQKKEQEHQRDLAHHLEVDHVATVEQQRCRNWSKTFLPFSNPLSDEKINLIDLLPLTKRQCVHYLPKKTLEAHLKHEELTKEMGVISVGKGSPCERCTDFRILCIP